MSLYTPDATAKTLLEVCDPRASSVIVHRVPPENSQAFLEWERGISQAAQGFAGYRGTEIYPPTVEGETSWVVIVHFDEAGNLKQWIDSPVRAEWAAKLPGGLQQYRVNTLQEGFGPWFSSALDGSGAQPVGWKMALTVLLGLYPTVMLLRIAFGTLLSPLGTAGAMLVSNAMSVSILQWGVMPLLQPPLQRWLVAGPETGRGRAAAWLALIVGVLAVQLLVFCIITG